MRRLLPIALLLAACCVACESESEPAPEAETAAPQDFPANGEPKADVFGRSLAAVAAPYQAAELDEALLETDVRARRAAAWATAAKVLDPVPLLGLAEIAEGNEEVRLPEGEVPLVPRFATWYGVDDLKRTFQHLYEELGPSGRRVRAGFTPEAVEAAFDWNATAVERSRRWPLDRYLRYVGKLGECPDDLSEEECAQRVRSNFSGASLGTARIVYSPDTARHLLLNYPSILECLETLDRLALDTQPSEENFTACFDAEFPPGSVLIKAQWVRADFGRDLPVYDTDAEALKRRLDGTAWWDENGDRRADPGAGDIYTVRLRDGSVFRLAGIHIMTKELRHWQWITLWWSDTPDQDFGADRPAEFAAAVHPVWKNYKLCAVADYVERDEDVAGRFEDLPSLAAALEATATNGAPSWCSNPYVEHGRNNAGTNCVGCHQHGGSTVAHDLDGDGLPDPFDLDRVIDDELNFPDLGRTQIREVFPADYLYSLNRVDDIAQMFRVETTFFDRADADTVAPRVRAVLELEGDAEAGKALFTATCARCHGDEGGGTERAPDLATRVPGREDTSLVQTLIQGRGGMPAWGDRFTDEELAHLHAWLRATFGALD